MVSLKLKLSFSPEYFMSSVYKRAKFASSFPCPYCCCSDGCLAPYSVLDYSGLLTCSGVLVLVKGVGTGIEGVGIGFEGVGIVVEGVGAVVFPLLLLLRM